MQCNIKAKCNYHNNDKLEADISLISLPCSSKRYLKGFLPLGTITLAVFRGL